MAAGLLENNPLEIDLLQQQEHSDSDIDPTEREIDVEALGEALEESLGRTRPASPVSASPASEAGSIETSPTFTQRHTMSGAAGSPEANAGPGNIQVLGITEEQFRNLMHATREKTTRQRFKPENPSTFSGERDKL